MIVLKDVFSVETINKEIEKNPKAFINECEEKYINKVKALADSIAELPGNRLVMLAGPSSSGKTTTAKILAGEFEKLSRKALTISLDDFYRDQKETLTFEDGTPDYETVHSLDVDYINHCLDSLIKEKHCLLPRFNFITKERERELVETRIESDEIVIVEGLHALNPLVTQSLNEDRLTKLYVSVSSRLVKDGRIFFNKRELRFIRRLVRDYYFRNSAVDYTFYLWNGVRMGEDRYLFPYSPLADHRINSIHPYEPCIFKDTATQLLSHIEKNSPYYEEANVLKEKLSSFAQIEKTLVPKNSLLREFIG